MIEQLDEILRKALQYKGSDIFVVPGSQIMTKASGQMIPITEDRALPKDIAVLVDRAYELAGRTRETLQEEGDDDFSFAVRDLSRFRCNTYRQRGSLAMTCRVVAFGIPNPEDCNIPDVVMKLADFRSGMILVTGPAGNGKSTTLACLVDKINRTRSGHIITIEDPIEYLHPHKKCLVSQREVPGDASTFARALRAALRQAPDVIMLGEMRDIETISTAITAAETGHLLLSSLHTLGAAKTIDRVIDAFPANQQNQIRAQLSMVLRAVVSQRLILTNEGKLHPVFEVMCVNPAIQNLIREGKTHQIDNAIFGGGADMLSMDTELARLLRDGKIDKDQAALLAIHPETVERQARFMR
ncbi:MAG: PilT/PilU family type 4a pilus ATPase [Clostridia bacterium]|nr:PilT/PilU family type 4a pilus ATPase [Clostridia bacterium]